MWLYLSKLLMYLSLDPAITLQEICLPDQHVQNTNPPGTFLKCMS